jgi:hypothetical protein
MLEKTTMSRMVREFVEIGGELPLSALTARLSVLLAELPVGARDAMVRPRGDDFFGRSLQLTYLRPQTAAERARDAQYRPTAQRAA